LLLFLDDFEDVIDAAGLVSELLAECPRLFILATSRERLHLRAEQRYRVVGLDKSAARELFLVTARASTPSFGTGPADRAWADRVCASLDGLPLAIQLCATQLELFPPAAVLDDGGQVALDLLGGGPRDARPDHASLRDAIDLSYARLTTHQRALFEALSVFIGGFDLSAVSDLGFEASLLQGLLDKSLVQVATSSSSERRFRLLNTVRSYAGEKLAASGREQVQRNAHAAIMQRLVSATHSHRDGAARQRGLDRLVVEIYNLRASLGYLLDTDPAAALRMAGELGTFWYIRGYNSEGRRWLAAVLGEAPEANPLRGLALLAAGQLAMAQSDFGPARALADECLEVYETCMDDRGKASALHLLGWLARETDALDDAYAYFQRSRDLLGDDPTDPFLVEVLTSLATVIAAAGGDPAEAARYLEECRALLEQAGDEGALAIVLAREGAQKTLAGRFADAAEMLSSAASRFNALGFKREEAWAWEELGEAQLLQLDVVGARASFECAEELFTVLGETLGLMMLEHHFGGLACATGRPAVAQEHFARGLAYFHLHGHRKMVARCVAGLADSALQLGQLSRAAELAAAASKVLDAAPRIVPEAEIAALRAVSDRLRGRMGDEAFAAAWSRGLEASPDEIAARWGHGTNSSREA
jgi:predicted ATPase